MPPGIIPDVLAQAGAQGVGDDIAGDDPQIFVAAHAMVEIAVLPDFFDVAIELAHGMRAAGFEAIQRAGQVAAFAQAE